MNLFVCDLCNAVDAVEIAYVSQRLDGNADVEPIWTCTQCQTGRWHTEFERRDYNPEHDLVINRPTGIGLG